MKLNQLIAIITGGKTKTQKDITDLYKKVQKRDLFEGLTRKYEPKDEEGDRYPDEEKIINFKVSDMLVEAEDILSKLWDLVYTQDLANCEARADIKINDKVLLAAVPVTNLMYLEKQLTDLHSLISALPTLNPGEKWSFDSTLGYYAGEPKKTFKTKKVPKNHVKAEATKEHPAQVEVYHEDVVVGTWTTFNYCSAISLPVKNNILARLEEIRNAVKVAREEANMYELAKTQKISKYLFDYILDRV